METDPSAVQTDTSSGPHNASAWSLVAGGLLFALGNLLHPPEHNEAAFDHPTWAAAHLVMLLSVPLLILGFPALYGALDRRGAGRLGLGAIVLGVFGLVGMTPGLLAEAFIAPEIGYQTMQRLEATGFGAVGGTVPLLWVVSSFPLALACYRAKLGPRWSTGLLVAVPLVLLTLAGLPGAAGGVAIIGATTVYGLVVALLGWMARDAAPRTPRRHSNVPAATRRTPYVPVARL
jgi:hypothetical protein